MLAGLIGQQLEAPEAMGGGRIAAAATVVTAFAFLMALSFLALFAATAVT